MTEGMNKVKLWYRWDELYPYCTFEEKETIFNGDDDTAEIDRELWEKYKAAAKVYWPLRRQLVGLVSDGDGY